MSEKLRKLRLERGLKQVDMAFELGISQKAYSDIERGKTHLDHDKMFKIAKIFKISPSQICPMVILL